LKEELKTKEIRFTHLKEQCFKKHNIVQSGQGRNHTENRLYSCFIDTNKY